MKTENARVEENIQEKINSKEYQDEVRKKQEVYLNQVTAMFDKFIDNGMQIKKAISATNQAMKDIGHPWAYYEGILETLRKAGRLRSKWIKTREIYKKTQERSSKTKAKDD